MLKWTQRIQNDKNDAVPLRVTQKMIRIKQEVNRSRAKNEQAVQMHIEKRCQTSLQQSAASKK